MATTTDIEMIKEAFGKDALKTYLAATALIGLAGGAGAGLAASFIKSKNPELTALRISKRFYDRKLSEIDNENWLNDIMAIKQKLDNGRISDEERLDLEKKYTRLINR